MESIEKQILERLDIGMKRYGHGVIVDSDTREWGTPKDSWFDMAVEEFLDALIYVVADYIRSGRRSRRILTDLELDYKVDDKFAVVQDSVKYLLEKHEPDDNNLIMHVLRNYKHIESPKHKMLISNLIDMLSACSQF